MFAPSVQLNAVCPTGTWARVEPRISGCQSQSPSISPAARLEVPYTTRHHRRPVAVGRVPSYQKSTVEPYVGGCAVRRDGDTLIRR